MVILITGKAGAGKTHYAKTLKVELEKEGLQVKWLDGDDFREQTGNQDYSDDGRLKNLVHAARIAGRYEESGEIVLLSFIAPRRKWRDVMRSYWKDSRTVYIPGGKLWTGTIYERPSWEELK
jgi:adenylylsulfate kinase-like enzyme